MKTKLSGLSDRYMAALRAHLLEGPEANLQPASGLGRQALDIGLHTLDVAKIHEAALTELWLAMDSCGITDEMLKRATSFFAQAITPIEETHGAFREVNLKLNHEIASLRVRTEELTASNLRFEAEVAQRKKAEIALQKSEQEHKVLLEKSRQMQEQLRQLHRQVLLAQEEERKTISRELHDEIAQTLAAINIHLAALKIEAAVNTKGLSKKIANTQRLVERSVKIVHRFARQLRPTVLDDLGLIPAIHSFLKDFMKRTGIHVGFTAFAGVEQLNGTKRTVLFRVAQEALTNVAQHAEATHVKVYIKKVAVGICMEIHDNGIAFDIECLRFSKKNKRLGLIGMRERVEMVGGTFSVESEPATGTSVIARIPFDISHKI